MVQGVSPHAPDSTFETNLYLNNEYVRWNR